MTPSWVIPARAFSLGRISKISPTIGCAPSAGLGRRCSQSLKIKDGLYWVGTLNPTLRVFDVIMKTEYGTTYNSYLIVDEKVALIDVNRDAFTDVFLGKIGEVIDPAKIDYVIIQHTEPDHTGSLARLLDLCPKAQVISTKIGAKWLREMLNRDFNSRTIEDGEEISLGNRTLRFMTVPFWHWPDTMFTYMPEDKILFPCDGFAAHFCDERMYDDLVDAGPYEEERLDYYDAIMRPFADKIYEGVQRVKGLEIEMILPSHGPMIRNPKTVIDLYERLSDANRKSAGDIAIIYASAYGNTRRMAEAIAEGAGKLAKVSLFDAGTAEPAKIRDALESSTGVIFGSCTINGDALAPIWNVLSLFPLVNRKGKTGAAFGSFGWSGEAVGMIEERMKGLRLKVVESGLKFCFVPTENDLAKCRAFGQTFAEGL